MKSVLLKDLYNLRTSSGYMLIVMLVFAVAFLPMGYLNFLFMGGVVFSVMVVNTFSYDEYAKWNCYALSMPIQKRDIVMGKFLLTLLLSALGILLGGIGSTIGGILLKQLTPADRQAWNMLLCCIEIGFCFAVLLGTTMIPLLFRFGVEKARLITLGTVAVPILAFFAFYKIPGVRNLFVDGRAFPVLMIVLPFFVLIWGFGMYHISCRIFHKKEF